MGGEDLKKKLVNDELLQSFKLIALLFLTDSRGCVKFFGPSVLRETSGLAEQLRETIIFISLLFSHKLFSLHHKILNSPHKLRILSSNQNPMRT